MLICRDRTRGEAAVASIAQSTGNAAVELVIADLASQRQVRHAAGEILARHPALNLLINNAAAITRTRRLTEDSIEWQFAVNHLAPFLLTHLLRPALLAGAPSRIVVVASEVESAGRVDFADLGRAREYDPVDAYCQSKLCNVLFTRELARRLAGTNVIVNCVHPGVVATQLLLDYSGRSAAAGFLNRFRYDGPERAARLVADVALAAEFGRFSGEFISNGVPIAGSVMSRDVELQRRLWMTSEAMTGIAASRADEHEA